MSKIIDLEEYKEEMKNSIPGFVNSLSGEDIESVLMHIDDIIADYDIYDDISDDFISAATTKNLKRSHQEEIERIIKFLKDNKETITDFVLVARKKDGVNYPFFSGEEEWLDSILIDEEY